MNIKKLSYLLAGMAVILASCSNIKDDERLIYVEPAVAQRNVLIEDFTGQRCPNCPTAVDDIHGIQEVYGEETVIAVAIHCGDLGFAGNKRYIGLVTEAGKEYWNNWFKPGQGQPVAKFNRMHTAGITDHNWSSIVAGELQKKTDVNINLTVGYDDATRKVTTSTEIAAPSGYKGKLQLWLVEDGIVAMQSQPDGSIDYNYVHNHVLRDAINGTWGEEVTFGEEIKTLTHTYTLPASFGNEGTKLADCIPRNCRIVAFVYDDNGVRQVVQKKIIIKE